MNYRHARLWALTLLICAGFLIITLASTYAERPAVDEGMFADPALNLYRNNSMGSLFLPGHNLKGIHERTYWIHPLHIVVQTGWYHVFGFSIFAMRELSIAFGLLSLFAWFVIAQSIVGDRFQALLITTFVARLIF